MLLQRQVRSPLDAAIDLTPMVDVVFQLLIFLMLTYRASAQAEVELPPAVYGTGVEETLATNLTLVPRPGGGVAVFSGMSTDPADALDSPEAIREAVAEGVRRGRRHVVLQADGAVSHGEVLRVGSIVAEVEGIILHLGVEDANQS
ncbi:ExbD/TolR family protein [Tautonia sociabilis]|uniref:Biopolymer transporter ExbD n=1 Tax=Tautonia sociabilis TaxID=2080755 RepID=A0A432MFT1_9BACT|nr:biopolymer transporter ExbD [Tautonia sociabilis]RUL85256.1 biopolymer transporter ExbD [Tautonia sociabilis]